MYVLSYIFVLKLHVYKGNTGVIYFVRKAIFHHFDRTLDMNEQDFLLFIQVLILILKLALLIAETDSMSIKYIPTLKTMKGVYVRWPEIIEEFTSAVIHTKVIVKDCISQEPQPQQQKTISSSENRNRTQN